MLQLKWKEAVVFDIMFHIIVNTVRKIAVAEARWQMLSSKLLFAELLDLRRPDSSESFINLLSKKETLRSSRGFLPK